MLTMSDVFLWRASFVIALIAALLIGVGLWRSILWIRGRLSASERRMARSAASEAPVAPIRA